MKLKTALNNKRLIFTISSGRSGTAYLANVLSYVPNVSSHHEPKPSFSKVMRSVQQNKETAYEFWIKKKLPSIAKDPSSIYIETTHMFCKGFIEPLLDLDIIPDLILLTRPYRRVALSFCRFGSIPGRTAQGLKYLLSPTDPDVLLLPNWQNLDDYQLCYWYCLEIARRSHKYSNLFTDLGARVVRVSLDEISTVSGFKKLLLGLNLQKPDGPKWAEYLEMKENRINTRSHLNRPARIPDDLDSAEKEVLDIIMKANEFSWHLAEENILMPQCTP
jgi:hypothetical protein